MASDFYSLSQKVPQEVKDRSKYHIAQSVFYRSERGVVVGKYWRRRTNEILYDLKVGSEDGKNIRVHKKVNEAKLYEWREFAFRISQNVWYKGQRAWVIGSERNEQGEPRYRIRTTRGGLLSDPIEIAENVKEDQLEPA